MYAPKTIVRRNDNYRDLFVKVLLTLGLYVVFNDFFVKLMGNFY